MEGALETCDWKTPALAPTAPTGPALLFTTTTKAKADTADYTQDSAHSISHLIQHRSPPLTWAHPSSRTAGQPYRSTSPAAQSHMQA